MIQGSYPQLAEFSDLKQQLTSVRMDFQKQSYELQAEREINIQLTSSNEELHQKLKESNGKLLNLQQRLNGMSENYEMQIEELKILVDTRSEELEELSRQLLPKVDEDMLRIRLLNQLEIPHREELDEKDRELSRIQQQLLHLQKDNEVLLNKIEYLQQLKEKDINELKRDQSATILTYKTEIQMLSEENIKGLDYSKKLRKEIEELKRGMMGLKQRHVVELDELNKENNKIIMNYGSDHEVRGLRFELEQKSVQLREEKEEIGRVRKLLDNSKEQYIRLQAEMDQVKSQSNILKGEIDTYQVANLELKLALEPVQNYEANIRTLRKEVGLKNEEILVLLEKIRILEDTRGRGRSQERTKPAKRGESQDDKTRENLRLREDIQVLSSNLKKKQLECQQLHKELLLHDNHAKRDPPFQDQTFRNFRNKSPARSPDRNLKQKLKEANAKIVELLQQKIVLKQKIIRFQRP